MKNVTTLGLTLVISFSYLLAGCGGKSAGNACQKAVDQAKACAEEICKGTEVEHYDKKLFCDSKAIFDDPAIKTCSAKCSKAFTRGMLENKHLNTCKRKLNGFSNALSLGCDADTQKYR